MLVGWFGLAGWFVGAALGLRFVPRIATYAGVPTTGLKGLAILLVGSCAFATALAALTGYLGRRLAKATRHTPVRAVDAVLGAVASLAVWACLIGLTLPAVRPALPAAWSKSVGESRVVQSIDQAMPDAVNGWVASLRNAVVAGGFPQVFNGTYPEPVTKVPAPDQSTVSTPGVARAAQSIVKIHAFSRSCGTGEEGSGWVVAAHRVVTNAHVVAGAETITLQVGGTGRSLDATVVAFDPDLDLAILAVPDLSAPALTRVSQVTNGSSAVVAGFPLDGSYTVGAARIRNEITAVGSDIYSRGTVRREVYSVYATVRPGNSGGPLLTTSGAVAGTVFARSLDDGSTGYALTDDATDALLDRAAQLDSPVSTQACLVG